MNYRIVKVNKNTIFKLRKAIFEMNLSTNAHTKKHTDYVSGSLYKRDVLNGGYLVYYNGGIVGWGAVFDNDDEAHLFVHREHRRKGIGSKIVERFKREYPYKVFCPWNRRVQGFFNKRNATYVRRYLWI